MKTLNAVIKEATIKKNDSNTGLEPVILLKFNSFEMYFGKDQYDYNKDFNLNNFVNNILNITEKRRWEDVNDTNIRVKIEGNNEIIALGHITNDNIWFFPNINSNHNIENTEELNYSYIVNNEYSKHFFVGFNEDLEYIDIYDENEISKNSLLKVKVIFYSDSELNVYYAIHPSYTDNGRVIYTLSDLVDEIKNILFQMLDERLSYVENQRDEIIIDKIVEKIDEINDDLE